MLLGFDGCLAFYSMLKTFSWAKGENPQHAQQRPSKLKSGDPTQILVGYQRAPRASLRLQRLFCVAEEALGTAA